MFYEFAITIPKSGDADNPKTVELHLGKGVIHHIAVQFPIGCAALAHCRLLHHSFGQLPTNRQGSFATDGYIIDVDENLEFFAEPYIIRALCWNDDDTYAHTITIRLSILESKTAIRVMKLITGLSKMLKLMGIKV